MGEDLTASPRSPPSVRLLRPSVLAARARASVCAPPSPAPASARNSAASRSSWSSGRSLYSPYSSPSSRPTPPLPWPARSPSATASRPNLRQERGQPLAHAPRLREAHPPRHRPHPPAPPQLEEGAADPRGSSWTRSSAPSTAAKAPPCSAPPWGSISPPRRTSESSTRATRRGDRRRGLEDQPQRRPPSTSPPCSSSPSFPRCSCNRNIRPSSRWLTRTGSRATRRRSAPHSSTGPMPTRTSPTALSLRQARRWLRGQHLPDRSASATCARTPLRLPRRGAPHPRHGRRPLGHLHRPRAGRSAPAPRHRVGSGQRASRVNINQRRRW